LTGGADIETGPAQSADLGVEIEWSAQVPFLSPSPKADGLGHHLFFTDPNASSAEDAIFILLPEALLTDVISRGKVLNGFRLRAGSEQQFKDHFTGLDHSGRCGSYMKPFQSRVSAGGDQFCLGAFPDLHDAETAGPIGREPIHMAKGGNGESIKP
jgi:hypothetical protein